MRREIALSRKRGMDSSVRALSESVEIGILRSGLGSCIQTHF